MGATAGASGVRSYIAARRFAWMTPKRLRATTIALAIAALLGSAMLGGSTPRPANPHHPVAAHAAAR